VTIPGTTTPDANVPAVVKRSKFWQMIADLPSTNFRIFVGVLMGVLFVIVTLIGVILGKISETNDGALYIVGGFILIQMGLDVAQFKFKRDTYQPAPPARPDVEDTPAH
jgi:small neutral amino acid transporter SnatA (MarC family)